MELDRLLEYHDLAKEEVRKYPKKRFLYRDLEAEEGKHFTGIVGPRGVGKTVLLRQYALAHDEAFYLSADVLNREDDPWELLTRLRSHYGFRVLLLDEIHFLADASGLLKRLYDFLEVRVLFSSSVSLAMHASAHDLSRRVRMRSLYPFSFREYLAFTQGVDLERLTLAQLEAREWSPEHLRSGYRFDAYLRGGLLPFSIEEPEPLALLGNILDKVIARDLPSVVRLAVDELDTIRRLLRFVGRAGVDGINYSSLAQNLGVTKYKAEQYVSCLEKAFVLHQIFPAGTNVLREPKVLMAPPCRLLYRDYEEALGGLREDFFAEAMKQAGLKFQYLKSTRGAKTPDYLIESGPDRLVVEIGGKGKGRSQFKGVNYDRKLIFAHTDTPDAKRLPLFLLGYLA